jgi:hypothetical protein
VVLSLTCVLSIEILFYANGSNMSCGVVIKFKDQEILL